MSDIVEDIRKASRTGMARWDSMALEVLIKCGPEIEKLRKEVKLLKARNTNLVWRLVWVMLIFAGAVCGTFMAVFLAS